MLKNYPELYNSRVTYHLIYATTYLVTTEGTQIRTSRSLAAIEASLGAEADDGTPVHNFLAIYVESPGDSFPRPMPCGSNSTRKGKELAALRAGSRQCRITMARCCSKRTPPVRCWRSCLAPSLMGRGRRCR